MANKRLKFLVLSHISELVGGAEMSMLDVFDSWAIKYGIEPIFILRKPIGSLAKELKKRGWKYHALEYNFWSHSTLPKTPDEIFRSSIQNGEAVLEIEKIIKKTEPDVVMTNSIVSPWASLAAYYQQVPHVWFVREYGDLDHGRVFEIGRKKTFEDVGNLSDLVVANSKTLAKHIEKYVDKNKVTTLYTPFDLEAIDKKSSSKVPTPFKDQDSLKLVITGSIAPSKGHIEAVEATALLNEQGYKTELCIIGGNGPREYRNKLKASVRHHHLKSKVHFIGHQSNPLAYVSLADVGIMASRKEAFGRVTFEYLAAVRPVVGANSGATPEMITSGKNGYLYKPGDSNDMARVLKNYAENRDLIKDHGKAARQKAQAMMESAHNTDVLYQKVLKAIKVHPRNVKTPIHFTHRLLEYQNIIGTNVISVKRLAIMRAKQHAKRPYRKAKGVARRIVKR